MKKIFYAVLMVLLLAGLFGCKENNQVSKEADMSKRDTAKIIIAHRGASGYLPEHTLASKALAYQMGVPFLEQDLAMTKDNRLVVIHDHFLDRVTDVADKFPGRTRDDGR